MSMYVELLSRSLEEWASEFSDDTLIAHARMLRTQMVTSESHLSGSAYSSTVAQIAYDRALVKLSRAVGVEVVIDTFAHPVTERTRLERRLAEYGIDVVTPTATST
jgi:hypothetical protein